MIDLANKVAIVTGGGSGIGRSSALTLARQGAKVIVTDINAAAADAVAAEAAVDGLTMLASRVDVSNENEIRLVMELATSEFGRLDILHSNAAALGPDILTQDAAIVDLDAEMCLTVYQTNVLGVVLGAKHAIPHLIAGGGGVIINTASDGGHAAELSRAVYGSSKAAIIGLSRSIATQYGKQGVRCVSISPGVIVTPVVERMLPPETRERLLAHNLTPREGTPQDIANMVAFAASDDAGFVTGVDIQVNGGLLSHFPGYADDLAAIASAP